jgi:hypothetical protein
MPTKPTVALLVGKPFFGLEALAEKVPVWAPDWPHYKKIAERVRQVKPEVDLTLYKIDESLSPEEEFLSMIPTVGLHHGQFSKKPWRVLEVHGAAATEEIAVELAAYGVDKIMPTGTGFRASRSIIKCPNES